MIEGPTYKIKMEGEHCLSVVLFGDDDAETASQFVDAVQSILDNHPNTKFDGMVDLARAGTSSKEATRIFASLMESEQIRKVAFINVSDIPKIFAELAIKFAKRGDSFRFFDTKEDALIWLTQ